jgi:hypothetical protein
MARVNRFTFVCDNEERELLTALAERLHRSQSDSIRWLIREAVMELQAVESSAAESLPAVPATGEVRHASPA